MVKKTNNRKQMWGDIDFVKELEKIKAKRTLNGNPINSIPELTKEILECPSFKNLVNELLNENKQLDLKIRFDKKRIW